MKNIFALLIGFGVGVAGTFIWLRKDIKKQIQDIENYKGASAEAENTDEAPFIFGSEAAEASNDPAKAEKTAYNNIPLTEKEAEKEAEADDLSDIRGSDETDGGVFEIDIDEMLHNHDFEKERYVYFRGDRIMCTESGTIIANPFPLVGGEWENCVGNYAENTAFIRNPKMVTDYEIYVEDGLYSDEYGDVTGDFDE